MAGPEERLTEWLRDAHAMEQQAETMLSKQSSRFESYPDLKTRIDQHLEETRSQSKRLEDCLERRGESASTVKDLSAKSSAMGPTLAQALTSDEVVKGSIAELTFEHFEIANYRALVQAAEDAGDQETRRVCEGILGEEQAMAQWLDEHLPQTTHQYLQREAQPS